MKDFTQYLNDVEEGLPFYYFLVGYEADGVKAKPRNPPDAQSTLEFYRTLQAEQNPQIWLHLTVRISGVKHSFSQAMTEQDCERAANDLAFWESKRQSIKGGAAGALMAMDYLNL